MSFRASSRSSSIMSHVCRVSVMRLKAKRAERRERNRARRQAKRTAEVWAICQMHPEYVQYFYYSIMVCN